MLNKPKDVPFCGVRREKVLRAIPILDEENLQHLFDFITERYKIHTRKDVEKLPPPWTSNPVLSQYRFTNIRREHDKETKWLIKNITSNNHISYDDKLLNCILFRLYNKHETAELLDMPIKFSAFRTKRGPCWNPELYRKQFEAARKEDPKRVFFTGAFITGGLKRALKWYLPGDLEKKDSAEMRVMWFMKHLVDTGITYELKKSSTQQEAFQVLANLMGIGEFLAYQMFVDMTYIAEFPFSENEFTVAGPGCKRGIDYLFEDKDGMTYEECLFWMRDNLNRAFKSTIGKSIQFNKLMYDLKSDDRCFNVMSLENCMCELSKYIRAVTNTGRPRQMYKPERRTK